MITLLFMDNIDGEEYAKLKTNARRLIETDNFDVVQTPADQVFVLSYIGVDYYSRQIFITSGTMGSREVIRPPLEDIGDYFSPKPKVSGDVLATEQLRIQLENAGVIAKAPKKTYKKRGTDNE